MNKLYLWGFLLLIILCAGTTYGQSPKISYQGPNFLTVGTKAFPITANPTGGATPNEVYSKASTVAGDGFYGIKDTLAKFARFASPISIAMDPSGNMFVADANLNAIRKISVNGNVTTFAGNPRDTGNARNGQDTAARFKYPTGVACDSKGNVYVADFGNNMIRIISPTGLVRTFAGHVNAGDVDGQGTNARFNLPYSLSIDRNDNVFVADSYNNKIKIITPAGLVKTYAGTGAPGLGGGFNNRATFRVPYCLAIRDDGFIYVVDRGNNCLRGITPTGIVLQLTDTIYKKPISVAVDAQSRVYLSTEDDYNIVQFDRTGKRLSNIPFSGGSYRQSINATDTLSGYRGSMGLYYDGKDNLLVTEPFSSLIRKVAVNGYSVWPRLPQGLSIDGTGTITGTPTVVSPLTVYQVKAYNNSGVDSSSFSLSVSPGSQTITFAPLKKAIYGNIDYPPGATSTGTVIPIRYTSSDLSVATIVKDSIHIVGAGTTVITASQAGNNNYTAAAPVSQTLIVDKAPLTITATDIIKTVGDDNPALPFSYNGFVYSDSATVITTVPVTATTVVKTTAPGDYPITISGAAAKNYAFIYVPGKLTVFPIPVITAIGSTSIVKGKAVTLKVSPSTGYKYQWTFNGNAIAGATDTTYAATQTGGYNVNITANKYTTYSLYTNVLAQLKLPADNFRIQLTSVTCKGSNNGTIFISAAQKLKYTVVITGNNLNNPILFTDTLTIRNLSPGNYTVCFSVEGEIFSQCNQVNITEPTDLSVFSTINKTLNNISLQLNGGRNYSINLNDVVYKTTDRNITLPLLAGANKLTVTTDNLCQGVIEKMIVMNDRLVPYPNPFNNILYVNVGNDNVRSTQLNIVGLTDGKAVYSDQYTNKSGVLELDLSTLPKGLYYLNLSLDGRKSGFKIIKK